MAGCQRPSGDCHRAIVMSSVTLSAAAAAAAPRLAGPPDGATSRKARSAAPDATAIFRDLSLGQLDQRTTGTGVIRPAVGNLRVVNWSFDQG